MFCTGCLHLPDSCCTCSLSILDHSCAMGPCLLDGFGSLGLVLTEGSFGVWYLLPAIGSMDALVVSSHPMALFILCCSESTSLERAPDFVPGWVPDWGVAGTLITSGVSDARVREGEWLIGMASLGMAACGDACWGVGTSLGMAETGLSSLSGSLAPVVNEAPWTTNIGLLRVLSPEPGMEVSSTTEDKSSWSSVAILGQVDDPLGHSMAKHGEEGGVETLQGPGMMGGQSPSIVQERSTCSSEALQTGLPRVFISQMGSFGSKSSTGSRPPFRPLGLTTCSPHCRSLCTSSW